MITEDKIIGRITISSNCECSHCESCSIGYMSGQDNCDECNGELTPYDCGGVCWEDSNYAGEYLIADYLKEYPECKRLRIEGRGMGWQSRSGHCDVDATWEEIRDALAFDGEFRIEFKLESGGILTARRWSHDEPMGARFSIYPIELLIDTLSFDDAMATDLFDEYGCHKGCGEYYYDCRCEKGEGK